MQQTLRSGESHTCTASCAQYQHRNAIKDNTAQSNCIFGEFYGSCSRWVFAMFHYQKSHWSVLWLINAVVQMINGRCYFWGVADTAVWNRIWREWWHQWKKTASSQSLLKIKGGKKVPNISQNKKKQEKCWISTVIISLFSLPWDPLGWVTRPMFFSLAGGPASSSLCHYFQTVSIKQPLCPQVEKMKNVRVAEGRTNMSDSEMLHSVSPTFSRTPFIFPLPLGEIAYVFFQIQSCDTSTAHFHKWKCTRFFPFIRLHTSITLS